MIQKLFPRPRPLSHAFRVAGLLTVALTLPTQAQEGAEWKPRIPVAKGLEPSRFVVPEGLEVTAWARTPLFYNPTNMDVDQHGRIWVAEGVNYRGRKGRRPEGDRIVVLQDKDGDGQAETSHTFVQEKGLVAPLGVAVFDNVIVVSQPPEMIVYTDVDRDLKFDPAVDKREVLLSGFNGKNHDHSLHSVTAGPDGLWYWNQGNTCANFTDRSGREFRIGSPYKGGGGEWVSDPRKYAGEKSDDGHVYIGGFSARMKPDGTGVEIIGYNYRNSYEQTLNSYGDLFQNDNDDPPACRTSYVLEYGNAGFASKDGKRSWQADQRPGQSVPDAEWRQDDPGVMPAGDVYGGGAPTGMAFYENGALGDKFAGMLLSCETGRNVVFGYHPKLEGAGYQLDRFDFLNSNPEGKFLGSDFTGGGRGINKSDDESPTLFRPSDVVVGPDGAIYVADWYDPRTGGHQDLDESCSGTIYRIAPKGFKPVIPQFDITTLEGQIMALKSPAQNVRWQGFMGLKARGAAALPAVKELMRDPNRWIAARGIWLLPHLGEEGLREAEQLLSNSEADVRIAAFRALRRVNHQVLEHAGKLAGDAHAAVRREAALAMRDVPFAQSRDVLVRVAAGFDGKDRTYLEALGLGATGKEADLYRVLTETASQKSVEWSPALARIAWRLMTPAAAGAHRDRALAADLPAEQRAIATDALAFINEPVAVDALVAVAAGLPEQDELRKKALWWLDHRANNEWADFGVDDRLAAKGIAVAPPAELVSVLMPPAEPDAVTYDPAAILAMEGDAERGKLVAQRCTVCHKIAKAGTEFGPGLTGWGKAQPPEVILETLLEPSKSIAHGYEGTELVTNDGVTIHGIVIAEGRNVTIRSMGGVAQKVPARQIKERKPLDRSLMLSAAQQGLQPAELADLIAYLRTGAE